MRLTSAGIADKDSRFTRQLSVIALVASFFYLIFDTFSGAYNYLLPYVVLIASAILALYLVEKKKIIWAKFSLLFTSNLIVAAFASVEVFETGIYFYFVLLAVAALTLFGYKYKKLSFSFVLFSIVLFLLIFLTDIQFIPPIDLTPEYVKTSMLLNFIIILVISIVIIYYLIYNNYLAESTLNRQRESLIQTTKELENSQRRFELAIQGSSAAIWDWDILKDAVFVTPKLTDILKRPVENMLGASREQFARIIHPDDIEHFNRKLRNHFEKRERFELEIRIKTGEGNYVWVLDSGQAEYDEHNRPVRMVGTIVDIHEKKMAVEQVKEQNLMLAKTNEELDRFVYSTSHDLRAPLSSLLGLINLADVETVKKERDELIKMMRQQIIKLDSYIQDITDYSRNARVTIEREHVDLKELINDALQNLRYMEGAENVEFISQIQPDVKIFTDKNRFKVILNNLVSNAIKYRDSTKKPYLKIHLESNGTSDILYFTDNGIGIEEKHLNKVFNMFYRASEQSRGSGLGLYISKEIANKIGIELSLSSKHKEGSTFKVIIPRQDVNLG